MTRPLRLTVLAIAPAVAVLTLSACGGSGGSPATPPAPSASSVKTVKDMNGMNGMSGMDGMGEVRAALATPTGPALPPSLRLAQTALGQVVADQYGRVLYAFVPDADGSKQCTDSCIASWPRFTAGPAGAGSVATEAGLDAGLATTADVDDVHQVKYGKWKLYYYVGDGAPGAVDGQGVDDEWFVVKADGTLQKQ